jgi:uncharacterized membrane protein YccC
MTYQDIVFASALGQLIAIGVVAVAWGLLKMLSLLWRIAQALKQTEVIVRAKGSA